MHSPGGASRLSSPTSAVAKPICQQNVLRPSGVRKGALEATSKNATRQAVARLSPGLDLFNPGVASAASDVLRGVEVSESF